MTTDQYAALEQTLNDRWSCRQFLPDAVPRETIDRILTLAQRTPSWCNTQPWQVTLTTPEGTAQFRKELLEHVQGGAIPAPDIPFPSTYTGTARDRRRECGFQLYDSLGIAKGDNAGTMRQALRNFELFDAPHVAIVTTDTNLGTYGAVDCGLYIGSFILAAQSLGVAATAQAALASYSPFIHEYFGIPTDRHVVVGLSFGYPDVDHPVNSFRTSRAALDAVATWHG